MIDERRERWEKSDDPDELIRLGWPEWNADGFIPMGRQNRIRRAVISCVERTGQAFTEEQRMAVNDALSGIGDPAETIVGILRGAREVEVNAAREWVIEEVEGPAAARPTGGPNPHYGRICDDLLTRYADHAARMFQVAVIRRSQARRRTAGVSSPRSYR